MAGNGGKKWPVGHMPAVHSSQSSLCAYELQKCNQTWPSRSACYSWERHHSGGPGVILHCTNSEDLDLFLGRIICTPLGLKCKGHGSKILEERIVLAHKGRFFCTEISESRCSSVAITLEGSTAQHSTAVCHAKLQRLGICIMNANFPSLPTYPK